MVSGGPQPLLVVLQQLMPLVSDIATKATTDKEIIEVSIDNDGRNVFSNH